MEKNIVTFDTSGSGGDSSSSSGNWLVGLLAIALVAGAIWYFTKDKPADKEDEKK